MKRLGKLQIQKLYKRCLNLVRRKPAEFFIFKKMRGCEGSCNWTDIEIDPRSSLLATFYHECIHYVEPNWNETQVLYAESRLKNNLTYLDHARFLKYVSIKLYKSELQRSIIETPKKKKNKKIAKNKPQ